MLFRSEIPANNFYQLIHNQERETIERLMSESLLLNKKTSRLLPPFAVKAVSRHSKVENANTENSGEKTLKSITQPSTIICGMPFREITETVIREGKMPLFSSGMGDYEGIVDFVEEPVSPNPKIFIIEEYTVASFIGSYGAGKVVKTMELLPGEERTYTVTSFRESVSSSSRAENVLESFTEDSTQEMQNSIDRENSSAVTDSSNTTHTAGGSVSVSGGNKILNINAEVAGNYNFSKNNAATRAANIKVVGRAVDNHVQSSNNHRELTVNTTSTTTVTERNEEVTVRKFQNINKSRVLNIVFRQLLQEYVTITYLSNIRVGFTNGYAETMQVMDIEELQTLLDSVILDAHHADALGKIIMHYCKVKNHAGAYIPFIEKKSINYGDCIDGFSGTEIFYGKIAGNLDTYTTGGLSIPVQGVILNVQKHILRTDSVVADALLGQGEALDCFNMRLQDAEAMKAHLANAELLQKMEIINNQEFDKAEAYKKVFGSCCETPQTQIIPKV